jgi:hypothetical protein
MENRSNTTPSKSNTTPNTPTNTPTNTPANSATQPNVSNVGGFSGAHTANPSVTKPADADASKAAVSSAPGKIDGKPAAVGSSIKR